MDFKYLLIYDWTDFTDDEAGDGYQQITNEPLTLKEAIKDVKTILSNRDFTEKMLNAIHIYPYFDRLYADEVAAKISSLAIARAKEKEFKEGLKKEREEDDE